MTELDNLVSLCVAVHTPKELALGWLRYEALRRLSPRIFAELHKRNIGGERFDDMVTQSLLAWKNKP
jgi:thymidylate synthase ThyX